MTAFLRAARAAWRQARNGDWYGAEALLLSGYLAARGVNHEWSQR